MTSIRAAVLRSAGEPAAVETLQLADPRDGEVRVRIQASGVCHSDLHVRDGAGRLPAERLIDRRIGLDDLEGAFDRLRAGVALRQVVVFD